MRKEELMEKSIMQQAAEHIELEKAERGAYYSEDAKSAVYDASCPVCGKNFVPAPYHVYKNSKGRLVCSYRCQMKS